MDTWFGRKPVCELRTAIRAWPLRASAGEQDHVGRHPLSDARLGNVG
jgi:hypothetical protein